jgi:kynurenine 3-monooxygenase
MVPFYGQGMNAGMEDVRVLFEFLDKHLEVTSKEKDSQTAARKKALEAYSAQRTIDAATINDLALQNYTEMRSSVRSPIYKARKWLEEKVDLYFPSLGWATQYSRVSFSNQRYSEVKSAVAMQGQRFLVILGLVGLQTVLGAALLYRSKSPTSGGRMITSQLAKIFHTR